MKISFTKNEVKALQFADIMLTLLCKRIVEFL